MRELEDSVRKLLEAWQSKTLGDLRKQAESQFNGTAFETLRVKNGARIFLVVCATGEHQISLIEKAVNLTEAGAPCNWRSTTLFDFAVKTERGSGLNYEDVHDASGKRCAVALCATRPDRIRILETMFLLGS